MEAIKNLLTFRSLLTIVIGFALGFWAYGFFLDNNFGKNIALETEKEETEMTLGVDTEELINEDVLSSIEANIQKSLTPLILEVSSENVLVVANQSAGNVVVMSMIALDVSGWVAIHEKNAQGELLSILGASRFDEGRHFAKKIELLRATQEGKLYVAVLHADNGNSEFEYETEVPVKNTFGENVEAEFIAKAANILEQ